MSHKNDIDFFIDPASKKRTMYYRGVTDAGEPLPDRHAAETLDRDAISRYTKTLRDGHDHHETEGSHWRIGLHVAGEQYPVNVQMTNGQFDNFKKWYDFGAVKITDFDNIPTTPTTPPPTLAQRAVFTQPIIFTAPGIRKVVGANDSVEHAYSMRDGRNALFLKYSNVDAVAFITGTGPEWQDRYQLHILTNNLVLYRIWCLASERVGLEYANEGLTTHRSASEYYILKQIAEGQASGTDGGPPINEVALKDTIDGVVQPSESPDESGAANGGQ